jgi:hypothetical protein
MNDALSGAAVSVLEVTAEDAASFSAANKRSGSLVPRRLSGSINSSAESSGVAFRDPAWAGPPEDEGAPPTGTLPSMGASTGRSASGSKTGRDAASIISSLVDASPNANQCPRNRRDSIGRFPKSVAFDALSVSNQCRDGMASRWLTQRSAGVPECDANHTSEATSGDPSALQAAAGRCRGRGRPA